MATYIGAKAGSLQHSETATKEGIVRSASEVHIVQAASATEYGSNILGTSGVPLMYSFFDGDLRLTVNKRSPRRIGKSLMWEVNVSWSSATKKRDEDEDDDDDDPVARPPRITIDAELVKIPFVRDVQDTTKLVVASNKQEFMSTPLIDTYVTILTYERYEGTFPLSKINTFQGTVNAAEVTIGKQFYDKKEVHISRITADNGSEINGDWVWSVQYVFRLAHRWYTASPESGGWMQEFLDQGTFHIDESTGEKRVFGDDFQNPTTGNLDGSGQKLADDEHPVMLWFNKYPTADFTNLNLT